MTTPDSEETPRPKRSLVGRLLRLLTTVAAIILLAPSVLTVLGGHKTVLTMLAPEVAKVTKFDGLVTHWWAPLEVYSLEVSDSTAEKRTPLLTVQRVTTKQPLWKVALSAGDHVAVTLTRPLINLSVSADGQSTNLEQTLGQMFPADDRSDRSHRMTLVLQDGEIRLSTELAEPGPAADESVAGLPLSTGIIHSINGTITTHEDPAAWPDVTLTASVSEDRQLPDNTPPDTSPEHTVVLNLTTSGETNEQFVTVKLQDLTLAHIRPLVARAMPSLECLGVVSGQVEATQVGGTAPSALAARVDVVGSNLTVRHGSWQAGERITLEQITCAGAGAFASDGVAVRDFLMESDVLSLKGHGEVRRRNGDDPSADGDGVTLAGKVDLAAISRMLPRTIHLAEGVSVESAELDFRSEFVRTATGPDFDWQTQLTSSPIAAVAHGKQQAIDTPLNISASGTVGDQGMTMRDLEIRGTFGQVLAQRNDQSLRIDGTIQPRKFWSVFRTVVDFPEPQISGELRLQADVLQTPDAFRLSDVSVQSDDLHVSSPLLHVYPDRDVLHMFDGEVSVQGKSAALRTVVSPWADLSWLSNHASVAARFSAQADRRLQPAAAVRPDDRRFSEANATGIDDAEVEASVAAASDGNRFRVEESHIRIAGLDCNVTGRITVLGEAIRTDLTAVVVYDIERVIARLIGRDSQVLLSGKSTDTFQISGIPSLLTTADVESFLSRNRLTRDQAEEVQPLFVQGGIQWQRGNAAGLVIGPGTASFQLMDGQIRTDPIQCSVGGGQLNVMAGWDVRASHLQLAPGSYVRNIDVSPALSRTWLAYVAPLMADSADVSGKLSCRVRSFDYRPGVADLPNTQCVLSLVDTAAVPGASLQPVLQTMELLTKKPLSGAQILFPDQEIAVNVQNGHVAHDLLRFSVAQHDFSTSGQVSANRALNLSLGIPIQRSTADRRGDSIQVPVSGTIDQPRIDTRGLIQNLGRREVEDRVNEQIDRGLRGLLDKLR